jgi:hypothetical protein
MALYCALVPSNLGYSEIRVELCEQPVELPPGEAAYQGS